VTLARLNLLTDLALAAAWSPLAAVFLAAIAGLNAFTGPTTAMTPRTTDAITFAVAVACLLCPAGVIIHFILHPLRERAALALLNTPIDPRSDLPSRLGAWSVRRPSPDMVVMVRRVVPRAVVFLGNSAMTAGAVSIVVSVIQGGSRLQDWTATVALATPVVILLNVHVRLRLARTADTIEFIESRSILVPLHWVGRSATLQRPLSQGSNTESGMLIHGRTAWLLISELSRYHLGVWERRCLATWLGVEEQMSASIFTSPRVG
jgi:hypothetical protein